MKRFKTNTVLALIIFLIIVIVACNQNTGGNKIIKTGDSEKTSTQGINVEVKETPKESKQEILTENIKTQSSAGQKNAAPTIMITEPDEGDSVTSSPFTIWWKAEDANNDKLLIKLEYQKQGQGWVLISDNEANDRSFLWDLESFDNGEYQLRATVTDGIASASATKSFKIAR